LTTSLLLLIFIEWAIFLLAVRRKSLISCICFGCGQISFTKLLENNIDIRWQCSTNWIAKRLIATRNHRLPHTCCYFNGGLLIA
jgi:hypothetical protein